MDLEKYVAAISENRERSILQRVSVLEVRHKLGVEMMSKEHLDMLSAKIAEFQNGTERRVDRWLIGQMNRRGTAFRFFIYGLVLVIAGFVLGVMAPGSLP